MIGMLILDQEKKEADLLESEAHRQGALLTDERWQIWKMENFGQEGGEILDIAYLDVTSAEGILAAEQVRSRWKNVYMVLIISGEISPLKYLRPTIMAASVLLRPFGRQQAEESLREAIAFLPSGKTDREEAFVIADRDGKVRLPLDRILYFEARAKKIYAALEKEEYGFYESMEHLLDRLPSYFIRCHRSYVVNLKQLKRYQASAGLCVLGTDVEIPVSRSYRQDMKERFLSWKKD